jgi:hydrogenase maturation protease
MKAMKRSLVFGAGNRLKTDDGVGIRVIHFLLEHHPDLETIADLEDGSLAGADVLPAFSGRDRVLIVDALLTGGEPGSVVVYTPSPSNPWPSRFSLHQAGLLDALAQLELLGQTPDIQVVGVIAEDVETPGMELTPCVEAAIPTAARAVRTALLAAPRRRERTP